MPKFKGSFTTIRLDIPQYIAELDEVMITVLEEGARGWVEAAVGRVPIWSGMARASLREISRIANSEIVISPLQAKSRIPQGEHLGDASLIARFPVYKLVITTRVPHFVIQDFDPGISRSAPWGAFDAGEDALREVATRLNVPPLLVRVKTVRKV